MAEIRKIGAGSGTQLMMVIDACYNGSTRQGGSVIEGGTRFVFRTRVRMGPWWLAASYWAAIIPADFVMSRQMLRGVKTRAEGLQAERT